MKPTRTLTTSQAAAAVRVSRQAIVKAIQDGRLPAVLRTDTPTPYYLISAADLDTWNQQRRQSTQD
jgi:excisionase family DNA binding protein